jgi:16S rRNA (guanine527-N7)-methyltransferase
MISEHLTNQLNQGLEALGLNISESQKTQILNYVTLLAKWNQVYNLTAVREIEQMISKHVLDCLAVLPYIHGTRILDVGTGAGLPGLLLAIVRPSWQCILLDSNAKKIRFVQQAIIELEIPNAQVVHSRMEKLNPSQQKIDEKFDTIISRAYSEISHFYQQTLPFCATGGLLLAMKGTYPATEIAKMADLPVSIESIALQVPQLQAQRHLIMIRC